MTAVFRHGWSAGRRADSSGSVARGRPLVALAIVEAAEELTVLLGGRATFGEFDDVIGLTALGRFVAVGVLAFLVPQLDGPGRSRWPLGPTGRCGPTGSGSRPGH